jgi:hypothetical protein
MLNIPAMYSEICTMNGVWECICQSIGGDIDGRDMNTDSGFSIRQMVKKRKDRV